MTTDERCDPMRPSMSSIGLVAYCALPPHMVFVRVPNERGRWLITDRCVVDVGCPACGAVAGEPCHNRKAVRKYHTGTHTDRRARFQVRKRTGKPLEPHKPHLSTNDIRDARVTL